MNKEETSRRFYTTQHPFSCGIDLHARTMDVCLLDPHGEVLVHRNMHTSPEAFLTVGAPYRQGLVVAVDCLFPWDGLADRCATDGLPFVLGHALSMKAIPGGQAKHDPLDAQKLAALLRGGLLPPAYVSPATRRATPALLRRRMPLAHNRAALRAHVQHTHSPATLPAIGKKLADKAHREGVAERFAAPAGQQRIAVDLALLTYYAALRRDVERPLVNTAKHPDATTLSLLHTVPGVGKMLRRVRRSAIHAMDRFPSGPDWVSSCRLVTCAKASAGKRVGTSGAKRGKAPLQWAFANAAVLFLSDPPAAQPSLTRLEKKHGKGNALTVLAQPLARAVYHMRKRQVAFARETFFPRAGRGAAAPGASRDTHGLNLPDALDPAASTASLPAKARRGHHTLSPALCLDLRSRSGVRRRESPTARVCCSSPAPRAHWTTSTR